MNKEHHLAQLLVRSWPFPRGSGRIIDRFFRDLPFKEEIAIVPTTDNFEMTVPPNDAVGRHIYLSGEFDRSIVQLLVAFSTPGDVLLDVGANLGYVTACFLKRVLNSTAIAVEPQPFIVDLLRRNLAQFGDRQRVFPIALSNENGEAWFYVDPQNRGKSRLVPPTFAGAQRIEARAASDFLAQLTLPRIDLFKIDVEGHEQKILESAKDRLRSLQPKVIVFEGNQGPTDASGGPIGLLLKEIGYTVYGLRKRLLNLSLEPVAANSVNTYNDYVAVSNSRSIPPETRRAFDIGL